MALPIEPFPCTRAGDYFVVGVATAHDNKQDNIGGVFYTEASYTGRACMRLECWLLVITALPLISLPAASSRAGAVVSPPWLAGMF